MKLDLLVLAVVVVVLVPTLSEGRIVSKCELKNKLWKHISVSKSISSRDKEHLLAVVICELNRMSHLNTSMVNVEREYDPETTDPVTELSTPLADEVRNEMPTEETPSEEMPTEEMPTEETPTEEMPTEEMPTEETPTEEMPSEETPSEETPTEETPSEETPTEETPTEETPSKEKPSKEKPSKEMPSKEKPSKEKPSKEMPSKEKPPKEKPSKEMPSKEKPSKEMPSKEMPSKEMPPKEKPPKEKPSKEMPSKEEPSKEMPSKKMPSKEMPTEDKTMENTTKAKTTQAATYKTTTTEPTKAKLQSGKRRPKRMAEIFDEEYVWTAYDLKMQEMVNLLKSNCDEEEITQAEENVSEERAEDGDEVNRKPWSLRSYGVFQLSDGYFCNSGHRWSKNKCRKACSAFTDDDITDDINCFMKIGCWKKIYQESTPQCSHVKNYFDECK